MPEEHTVSVRVEPEIYKWLMEMSKLQDRSINKIINRELRRKYVAEHAKKVGYVPPVENENT